MDVEFTKEPRGQQGSQCVRIKNIGSKFLYITVTPAAGNSAILSSDPTGPGTVFPPLGGGTMPPTGIGPNTAIYIYPGHWTNGSFEQDPWKDVTTIDGEVFLTQPNTYRATFSRSSVDQAVNPTTVIVDIRVSESGGRGHGG